MAKRKPPNDNRIKSNVRSLRQAMTFPKRLLWSRLRVGRLDGLKFRRQHPVGPYVVDFFCHQAALVIELDGMSHVGQVSNDRHRQSEIERSGYRVLRITNDQVLEDLDSVLDLIVAACGNNP